MNVNCFPLEIIIININIIIITVAAVDVRA
jgi:hypothetical protein